MNVRNDPVFSNSLREVIDQGGPNVRLGLINGRVYDKDSTKFKIYAGLAKFFHVRSEKSARHVDLLSKLVIAKSQIDHTNINAVANTAINALITKMTRSQEIRTIVQHPENLDKLCHTIRNLSQSPMTSVADRLKWLDELRNTQLALATNNQEIPIVIKQTMARLVSDLITPAGITNMTQENLRNVLENMSQEETNAVQESLREINPQTILDYSKKAIIQEARNRYRTNQSS